MSTKRLLSKLPTVIPIVLVLTAYTFFASIGTFDFRRVPWDMVHDEFGEGYYASLTEGFLRGQLSMAHVVDPKLKRVPDPYNYEQRMVDQVPALWDASYFHGKFYLYFSPLPVFFFYLPYRLLRGGYPPDALAGAFFSAWAFLMAVATARRAFKLAGRPLQVPWWLWVLFIGLGSVLSYNLSHMRVYEVAAVTSMAMTATWAYWLVRFTETGRTREAAWMGVWLALAIAMRPNVGVILIVVAVAVIALKERRLVKRTAIAVAIPLIVAGTAMAIYNYARFRNPFELGVKYQISFVPMRDHRVCSLCGVAEGARFVNSAIHYVFWAPTVGSEFPFVDLQHTRLDPAVSFPGGAERAVGIAPLIPLSMLALLFAVLILISRRPVDLSTRVGLRLLAAAWLILLGLSACWWVVSRYSLDFMLLMIVATAILIESGLAFLRELGFAVTPLRIACIVLACYSVAVGFGLGFMGPEKKFERANPELFQTLEEYFQ